MKCPRCRFVGDLARVTWVDFKDNESEPLCFTCRCDVRSELRETGVVRFGMR